MYLRNATIVATLGVAAMLLTGCSTPSSDTAKPTETAHANTAQAAATWSYEGDDGPDHWGVSSPTCKTTSKSEQSPINIDNAALKVSDNTAPVKLALQPAEFGIFNNGHTVEAAPETAGAAGSFTIGTETYTVAQFHFHDPSEHTIDGKHAPLEMHVVGKTADGEIAVLGVLFEVGSANEPLAEVFDSLPSKVTEEDGAKALKNEVDLNKLVPADSEIVRYEGSLTTPPCSEGVVWDVYLTHAPISQQQLDAFSKLYPNNARPTQELNGRVLSELAK